MSLDKLEGYNAPYPYPKFPVSIFSVEGLSAESVKLASVVQKTKVRCFELILHLAGQNGQVKKGRESSEERESEQPRVQ